MRAIREGGDVGPLKSRSPGCPGHWRVLLRLGLGQTRGVGPQLALLVGPLQPRPRPPPVEGLPRRGRGRT